ncbi:hypothetical protein [Victivallis lenta]|uniref:hypothetical protein n=1 Tax=Victivallis lenta TaxID=2606640 RepID=UPI003AF307F0
MAVNDRYYEFINDNWAWYNPVQDLFLLKPSAVNGTAGGTFDTSYTDVISSASYNRVKTELISLRNGARLVLGGTSNNGEQGYILHFDSKSSQKVAYAVQFAGDGQIDFTNNTGAANARFHDGSATNSDVQTLEKVGIYVSNTVDISYGDNSYWSLSDGRTILASHNADAIGFKASGALSVNGSMNAKIETHSDNHRMSAYWNTIPDKSVSVDIASNNTAYSAAFRASSLSVEKDFTSEIISSADNYVGRVRKTATLSGNSIGSYGIWLDNALKIDGVWNSEGTIVASTVGTSIGNVLAEMDKDDKGSVSGAANAQVNNNSISSIGIQAGDISLSGVGKFVCDEDGTWKWIDAGSISVAVRDAKLFTNVYSGDAGSSTMTGNTFNSIAISGKSLTVNGAFEANLSASVSNIYVNNESWSTVKKFTESWGSNTINHYGIRVTDGLTSHSNFGGTITLKFDNTASNWQSISLTDTTVTGIRASSISIDSGVLRSDINITVNGISNNLKDAWSTSYVTGIDADTLSADAFTGSISSKAEVNGYGYLINTGMYIHQTLTNSNDGTFDIAGNLEILHGDYSIGIMGGFESGLDLRISGSIITNTYAIVAGEITSTFLYRQSSQDDRVVVAAGAYVQGGIELGNGQNTLIVDSNARIYGYLQSSGGSLNLEYVLNSETMGSITAPNGQEAIIQNVATSSYLADQVNVTVNLNNAEAGSVVLYQSSGDLRDWTRRTIDFKYQGIDESYAIANGLTFEGGLVHFTGTGVSGQIAANGGSCVIKNAAGEVLLSVSSQITNGKVIFTVSDIPQEAPVQRLSALDGLSMSRDYNAETIMLGWQDSDGNMAEDFELEYRIVTTDIKTGVKTYGKSIVQMVSPSKMKWDENTQLWTSADGRVTMTENGRISLVISGVEPNATVDWRVRQNLGGGDMVSSWADFNGVCTDKTYDWVCAQPTSANFVLGKSGGSSMAELVWEDGASSEGIVMYRVRYVQSPVRLNNGIDWNNTAYIQKDVSAKSILLSGLNNQEYFYWQVQAVDQYGHVSEWTDGELFRVYNNDTTPPVFSSKPVGSVEYKADSLTDTTTMDLILRWNAATDDRSGVSRYTVRWRLKDSGGEWDSADILVTNEKQKEYEFRLSDFRDELLPNGIYEWEVIASDYVGNTTSDNLQKGEWVPDLEAPSFRTQDVSSFYTWVDGNNPLSITVNWTQAVDVGSSGLLRYELKYRVAGSDTWEKPMVIGPGDLTKNFTLKNADWEFELSAFDVAGNQSNVAAGTWLGDNVAPVFVDAEAIGVENKYVLASKTNTLVFNWSTALDNSTTRPNSGVEKYVISFTDKQGKLHTYEAGANQASLTLTVGKGMQLRDLEDGSYSWDVTVYDKAGNSTTVNGGEFLIDTTAPQGSFTGIPTFHGEVTYTTSTESSTGGRIPGFGSPPSESGETTVVETVTDVWVEFSFPGNFTDNSSGVQYVVQVSNNAKFTGDRTYEFVTSEQTLRLDSTNGFGVGSLAQNKEVYWRVQAMDSMGNRTGLWTQGEGFYFIGDQMTSYIRDVTIPTNIESTSTITVKGNQVELGWSASYDLFGVEWYEIRYTAKGGKAMTVRVSAVDVSTVLTIKDDGEYSWSVRAVDYVGNTSEWTKGSSFIVDMTAPAIIRDFTVTSAEASKDISFSWSVPYDAMGVAGYIITIRKAVGTGYTTQYHYISDPKATNVTLYNQEDGDYWFSIQAYDKAGNLSGSSSEKYVYVDASADAGNDFNTATQLAWGTSEKQSVGGTDVKDVFKVTLDGAAQLAISIRNVLNLGGKNSGVKVTIYNSDLKKLKSYTVKPGSQDLPLLLCDVAAGRDYYIEVVSADKKTSAKYEISADQQLFPAKTGNDSFETAKQATITLDGKGSGSFRNGWVGFGDAVDFYYIDAAAAGSMTVSLSNVTAKLKVTLYNEQGKKLKSVTVSGDKAVFENLLVPGAAYLSVESGDKGKGKQNSYYDISISDKYFPTETVANNSFEEAYRNNRVDLSSGSAKVSDWVGYGDAVDYYYLGASGPGEMTVTLSNVTAKLKVTLYNEQGKKLKSVTVSGDKTAFEKLLVPGAAYLSVESGDKGKGKQNSYYDITINDKYFPTEAVANNSFAEAEEIKLSTTVNTSISGWVGYQDGYDYYKLMATGPGSFSISINGVDPDKKLKVSLYDANQKKIKTWSVKGSDMLFFDKELLTGQTYLVVESGDKGKGKQNSDYSISVAVNEYFPKGDTGNNELAAARTVNFDSATGTAALSNEWVGYGDAKDFFAFELDSASKVDLDLNYYNKDLRFGKDVKINLYDMATGKKIKLDDALTSVDILEANTKYAVSVEIANEKKHWTGYDLAISKLA